MNICNPPHATGYLQRPPSLHAPSSRFQFFGVLRGEGSSEPILVFCGIGGEHDITHYVCCCMLHDRENLRS
ncbi:hypothetical protein M413DRAFT_440247 [Hebeloma cylindrosporum]|uniref:Uncharacterized protein n=1 Tax=Hebeloma cylindrosporum TaxID=76867 RepID=A0A0C2Z0F4_HEBCY|nr:hypothetical protein M413DRAFT_440247 [Hebeloma cylindrosporum h7]